LSRDSVIAETADRLGGIDVLVSNAGAFGARRFRADSYAAATAHDAASPGGGARTLLRAYATRLCWAL
jgi:NAD(P)-dependent dehydrogenase (short-subunit alcohol dehydrogenase family)